MKKVIKQKHWLRPFSWPQQLPRSLISKSPSTSGYRHHQTPPLNYIFRGIPLTYSLLVVPTSPVLLLERYPLAKWEPLLPSLSHSLDLRLTGRSPSLPVHTSLIQVFFFFPVFQVHPKEWVSQTPLSVAF